MPRFHVARSTVINASPERVFQTVADYNTWTTWSPWLCAEPEAEVTVTAESAAVGSVYAWDGQVVGAGELEHQVLEPPHAIRDVIRFKRPFRSTSEVTFELQPAASGTEITWHMNGALPWFLFWMRAQMEAFIGMDYARGLAMLKEWIETGQIQSQVDVQGIQPVGPLRMAGVRRKCAVGDVGPSMEEALSEAHRQFAREGIATGEPMSVYHAFDAVGQTFDYTSGYTLCEQQAAPNGLALWELPQVNSLAVVHTGSYDHLGNAWSAGNQHVRYKKLKQRREGCFEIYKNDPGETPPGELRTEIFFPLRT